MMKKLYRSVNDRMLAGVCGGIGEHFNLDPTIIRLAFIASLFFSAGTMIIVYVIAAVIIPNRIDVN